jgi:hypothetical protein
VHVDFTRCCADEEVGRGEGEGEGGYWGSIRVSGYTFIPWIVVPRGGEGATTCMCCQSVLKTLTDEILYSHQRGRKLILALRPLLPL